MCVCVSVSVQEKLYSPQQLPELMSVCDYVVMATPYTPATHQLINADAIAAMKPNGVLVNVGRGKCIDEAALIAGVHSMWSSWDGEGGRNMCALGLVASVVAALRPTWLQAHSHFHTLRTCACLR